jgi:hypothetical protein
MRIKSVIIKKHLKLTFDKKMSNYRLEKQGIKRAALRHSARSRSDAFGISAN